MKKTYKTPKSMFLGMDIDNVILAGSDGDKYVPIVPDEDAKRFSFGLSDDDDEEDFDF